MGDPWQVSLNYLMSMVVLSGLIVIGTYWWINKYVLTDTRFYDKNEHDDVSNRLFFEVMERPENVIVLEKDDSGNLFDDGSCSFTVPGATNLTAEGGPARAYLAWDAPSDDFSSNSGFNSHIFSIYKSLSTFANIEAAAIDVYLLSPPLIHT